MQSQVIAMWRAQPGALMLLGRVSAPPAKAGSVRAVTALGALGVFRAEFWPMQGDAGFGFLAAIRLPDRADPADTAELVLRGARSTDADLRLPLVAASGEPAFGKQVAALAGPHGAKLARFMLDVMRPDDVANSGSDMRRPDAVLAAFLTHAARPDGCVELIMHVPGKCVLLQGWGVRAAAPVDILLAGATLPRYAAQSADFARSDVVAPAGGSLLALPPEAAGSIAALERVFLLAGDDLLCRQVVDRKILDQAASVGQIRHLLPRLNCSPPLRALLRASLQPHYEGRETLTRSGRPVRAALDMAVAAERGGAYLSGWLFDPGQHVAECELCADGFVERLDQRWVRIPREDVSAAFRADPAFPAPVAHDFGFAAATEASLPPGQSAYLRFTFTDGDIAFMPVHFANPGSPAVLDALLASVDLHKSSGFSVVDQHLAPFVSRLPLPPDPPGALILEGPLHRPRAIVVPLRTAVLPRSFVSSFLLDPASDEEQVMFVCGPEWDHGRREALVDLLQFYGLPASIIVVGQTPHPAGALRVAAAMTGADSLLMVSAGVVGPAAGWRAAMYRAARDADAVCPTVIYEDRSIRFAGPATVTFAGRAPFVAVQLPLAGASAEVIVAAEPAPLASGSFACCLVRRSALPALAQTSRFGTEFGQETAFFLALNHAGLRGLWAPSIQVMAPEDDPALTRPTAPLIDGWILRQTWKDELTCAF